MRSSTAPGQRGKAQRQGRCLVQRELHARAPLTKTFEAYCCTDSHHSYKFIHDSDELISTAAAL